MKFKRIFAHIDQTKMRSEAADKERIGLKMTLELLYKKSKIFFRQSYETNCYSSIYSNHSHKKASHQSTINALKERQTKILC